MDEVVVPLTLESGSFVAELKLEDVPRSALAKIGDGFCDCVAVMLAAADEPAVRILCDMMLSDEGTGASRVLLGRRTARATDAALINGTAAHAFDYDDIGLGAHPAHPSAVLVPAILALADRLGSSGSDMLVAYVAGYEVWGEVALRDADQHLDRGWHPTGVFGPLAAAAAAARLLGLDAAQASHAIGIAVSRSSGLLSNYGTMTKPMHAGLAAQAGVMAAQLASRGFTAGSAAVEHERGLLRAVSPHGRVDLARPVGLGRRWNIVDLPLGFKQYPVCYAMHRAIDAAIDLRGSIEAFDVDAIERVRVTIGTDQAKLLHIHEPVDAMQAKFSLEFGVAAALLNGRLALRDLCNEFIGSEALRSLMARVETRKTELRDPTFRIFSPADRVEVAMQDGSVHACEVSAAQGHPDRPLAAGQLRRKFDECAGSAFGPGDADAMFRALRDLQALPDARELPWSRR